MWWCRPIILATWEAEARELLEGQVWWLTPVIQALWRPRRADHLRSGVQDQPDQHGETLSSKKKNKKQKKGLGAPVIPATWRLRQENCLNPGGIGCSELRSRHCTQPWHLKKKKNLAMLARLVLNSQPQAILLL